MPRFFKPHYVKGGLVLYLHMDDIVGGQVLDVSGQANHGTIFGAVTATGKRGMGLSFDGVNDYVDIPLTISSIYPVTLEAWVKSSTLNQSRAGIISVGSLDTGYRITLGREAASNRLYVLFASIVWIDSGYNLSINTWYHIITTIIYNSLTEVRVNIYVSGNIVYDNTHDNPNVPTTASAIGKELQSPGYFSGIIDEVRIYNRALTPGEIKYNYLGCRDIMRCS